SRIIVGVFYLVDFSFDLLLTIIMANLPPPNNDPNILEDEHAPAPEHAPITPNHAPIQPNEYLANDEVDPEEEPEEEEEPITGHAPAAPAGFAPQWIGGHDPNNNNGWIEEDDKDEVEAEEEDEEEMEDEEDEEMEVEDNDGENDDAEVYNPYEEVDLLNRPPPSPETAKREIMNAPVTRSTLQPISPIRQFTGTFYVGGGSSTTVFNPALCKVYPLKPMVNDLNNLYSRVKTLTKQMWDRFRIESLSFERVRDGIEEAIRAERERVREEANRARGPAGGPVAVATLGLEVANGKSWTEVKQMMIDKFCLTEEVQRLEDELRKGLPEIIKGETTSSRPTMLNEVVRMEHTLMEQKIQAKNERIAEGNKRRWENNNQGRNNNRNNNYYNNNNRNNHCNYRDNNRHNQYNQRRQEGARAMTAAQNNVVDQEGLSPKCNHYGMWHFKYCPAKCTKCNKRGHKTKDCRARVVATGVNAQPIQACYECGDRNHDRSRCPNLADQRGGNATGRAYALRNAEQGQGPNVVTEMFLLNNRCTRVFFDSGSDNSFVNSGFSHLIDIKLVRLNISYDVKLADGKLVSTNTVLRGFTLNLLNQLFEVDLMPIELGTFDVIIGMDWLVKHDALIVCGKKEVHIPVKGKMLVVKGNCDKSRLKVVSCIKARKYIERGCHLFVAHVTEKEPKEKRLEDVPIIRDFLEVYPDDLSHPQTGPGRNTCPRA
ncbi:putative reverse transcriptase domain-containing protein, partial [Tanacetum coccineum]